MLFVFLLFVCFLVASSTIWFVHLVGFRANLMFSVLILINAYGSVHDLVLLD